MAVVTMRQMLESGVHFGHQTRRWNPKMKRFILTERNGIYIIDLTQSLTSIDRAYAYVQETVVARRHGHVRRHQEAGPGGRRRAGDPRRHAVRQRALARRHAHQLPDRLQAAAAPQGARADRLRRRRRLRDDQEGAAGPASREGQARAHPRRHPGHGQGPRRGLGRRHQEGAHRRRRGPQAGHPGHRDPRLQLRSRRRRLPDPRQRRRDPRRRPADPGHRRRRRRGPGRPGQRGHGSQRRRGRAAGRVGGRAAGRPPGGACRCADADPRRGGGRGGRGGRGHRSRGRRRGRRRRGGG